MTAIDKIQNEALEQEGRATHALALINALAPDPSKWEYRGECVDGGGENCECACGHPIRWCFPIYFESQVKIVGSTCVNHFAAINPETGNLMLEKLAELEAKLASAKKEALAAQKQAEVEAIKARYEAAYDGMKARMQSYESSYTRAPYELWQLARSSKWGLPRKAPNYKRACDFIRWYSQSLARIERLWGTHAIGVDCRADIARLETQPA